MKFRNLILALPVMAACSCTFDEGGLPGGRRPDLSNKYADGQVYKDKGIPEDIRNPRPKDLGLDESVIRKDSGIDSMVSREDAGRDLGTDSFGRDSGVDAPYFHDAGTPDSGHDLSLARDMGRDLGEDVYRPDMGRRDGFTIFPDIIIRPFDLGSDARDGSLDLGRDGLTRDLGLDGIVVDAGRDLGPDGQVLPRPYECDANTVALYHFDQPDPFLDSCGNHHLTNNGTTEVAGQPGFGEARSFNGIRDYLGTPSTDDLNFGDRQGFRIRANIRTTAPLTNYDTILGKTVGPIGGPATGYSIFYHNTTGWACLYWDRDRTEQAYSLETLNDGLWHEIVCERTDNGTRAAIYIDGIEKGTAVITPANINSSGQLLIGNMEHGIERNQGYFEGEIDRVEMERIDQDPI